MRQAGEQRRLHEAEYDRGMFGAELTLAQFTEYLEFLQKNYPKWVNYPIAQARGLSE